MLITMPIDSIIFPLVVLFHNQNTAQVSIILHQAAPRIWFEFFFKNCPGFRNSPYQIAKNRWIIYKVFVSNQTTLIGSKTAYKPKLSLQSLLCMSPQLGYLSVWAEILAFLSVDVAMNKTIHLYSWHLDSQELEFVNTINIIFNHVYNIYRFGVGQHKFSLYYVTFGNFK